MTALPAYAALRTTGGSGCCRVILNDDGGDGRLVVCFAALDAPELQALDPDYYPSAVLRSDGRVDDPKLGWFGDLATWASARVTGPHGARDPQANGPQARCLA